MALARCARVVFSAASGAKTHTLSTVPNGILGLEFLGFRAAQDGALTAAALTALPPLTVGNFFGFFFAFCRAANRCGLIGAGALAGALAGDSEMSGLRSRAGSGAAAVTTGDSEMRGEVLGTTGDSEMSGAAALTVGEKEISVSRWPTLTASPSAEDDAAAGAGASSTSGESEMSGAGSAVSDDDFIGVGLATGAFTGDANELNFCDGLASRDENPFGLGSPDRRGPGIPLGRFAG